MVAVSPSLCPPQERPVRQRSGLAVTEEWRPRRRRATRLPEEEQATQRNELSGRRCHATATSGLHRSWWTLVTQGVGTAYTPLQRCGSPRADGLLPLRDAHTGPLFVAVQNIATCPQFRSRTSRVVQTKVFFCPYGLCKALRHLSRRDELHAVVFQA